MTAMKGQN